MKRFFSVGVTALVAVFVLGFSSCVKDTCTEKRTFTRVDPVYVQAEDFRIPLEVVAPQALVDPGIVYAYGSYLLINEKRKGVHVIDNTNPASPVPISFIKIPGNVDFAVRDGYLYADSYLDLLTIDIRQANAPIFVSRKEDVFKPLWADQNFGYCVYYKVTAETTVLDCADNNFNQPIFWTGGGVWANAEFIDKADNSGASGNGVGGSFAKFTLSGSRLYMVDQYSLNTYNVDNASNPVFVSTLQLGWGIETIFPIDGNLFVGSTNGVHILSIANPDQPKYLSKFDHASSCDPVYVVGNTAYVTLRSGTRCQGFTNQLDILDVSDLRSPSQISTFAMDNPHGLSIVDKTMYLCEGIYGLKVYDVTDNKKIELKSQIKNHHAFDVIALDSNLLMMIGDDGFYQYDISDPLQLKELSRIEVQR